MGQEIVVGFVRAQSVTVLMVSMIYQGHLTHSVANLASLFFPGVDPQAVDIPPPLEHSRLFHALVSPLACPCSDYLRETVAQTSSG